MPKFIIDVMSNQSDSDNALALPGCCQYAQEATSTPTKLADFAAQTARAEVTPHGRPASAKVAKLSRVKMIPPHQWPWTTKKAFPALILALWFSFQTAMAFLFEEHSRSGNNCKYQKAE